MIANTYVVKPFGISEVKVIALKGEPGGPTQEQVNAAVEEYMDDHPEAQIPDGAVTTEKLASNTVAPYADNLVSSSYVSDSEPYLFRKTFAGVREDTEIVGGSVVWNQLIENGDFANGSSKWVGNSMSMTYDANKATATITSSVTTNALRQTKATVKDHVYFATMTITPSKATTVAFYIGNAVVGQKDVQTSRTTVNVVCKAANDGTYIYFYCNRGTTLAVNDTCIFENMQATDLTLMFGPTIADYIYSVEQATAGAGVALAKKWAGIKGYIPYDAGTLKSVSNVSAHKMVGKNLATELEIGTLSESSPAGTPFANMALSNNARMRSKTLIPTFNRRVTLSWDFSKYKVCVASFDENGNYLGISSFVAWKSSVYVMSDTVRQYIAVLVKRNDGANMTASDFTDCKLQVEFGETATSYVPHQEWSYPLDSSLTLRGITKLDANNNLYYDGDVYKSDGTVERKYGYRAYQSGDATGSTMITDGTHTVYKLTTATTETADPYTNPQVCYPNGTEEYIDTRDVPIPVGHNTKYMRDLKKLLEGIPDAPTANGTYVLKATVSSSGVTYSWVEG